MGDMVTASVSWVDWAIVAAYLVAIIGVGFVFSRRSRSADSYFKGGGRLPWWVTAFSIYAATFSPLTFLAIPALVYSTDLSYYPIFFGSVVAAAVAVRWFLPFFHDGGWTSAYEYLERRFNLACRMFASAAFILFMISLTAIVAYLPAVALSAVSGLDVNLSIVVVMAAAVVYTALGGMEALAWADFAQTLLIFITMFAVVGAICLGTDGGLCGVFSLAAEHGKLNAFDLSPVFSRPGFWVVLIGGTVANLATYISDQRVIQRYLTVKDVPAAAKSMWTQIAVGCVSSTLCFFIGLGIWALYQSNGAGFPSLARNDQIFPVFIAAKLPTGLVGLAFAGIAAASVSTLSANMNSTAAAFATDFYGRLFKGRDTLRCGRVASLACGVLGCAFAVVLANSNIASAYEQFQRYLGMLTAGLACLFLMGRFMPRVDGFCAVCGLLANYVVTFALDSLPWPGKPHLLLYGLFGMVACFAVALAASWLRGYSHSIVAGGLDDMS